MTAILGVISW